MTAATAKTLYRVKGIEDDYAIGYEAATQSFKAGDLLKIDSSGLLNLAAAAGSNVITTDIPCGVALEDASGTTSNAVKYAPFTDKVRLRVPVNHGTAASAVTAITLLNETYVLKNDATAGWSVMIDTSTNGCALITKIDPEFPIATQYGMVEVQIIQVATAKTRFPA